MKSEFKCVYCHQAIWQSDHLEWQGTERGEITPESYREQDVFWYHVARNVENDEIHFISKAKYGSFDQFDAEIWQTEKIGAFWQQLTSALWLLTCFNVEDGTKCGFREYRLHSSLKCQEEAIAFLNQELPGSKALQKPVI